METHSNLQDVAAALQLKRQQIEQTRLLHARQAQEMLSSVSYTAFRQVYSGTTGPLLSGPPQPSLLAAALPGAHAYSIGELERQRLVKINADEIEKQRRLQLVTAQRNSSPPTAFGTQQQHHQHLFNRFGPTAVPPPPVVSFTASLDPNMQRQQQQQRLPQQVLVRVKDFTHRDPTFERTDRANVLMSQANREVEQLELQEKLRDTGRGRLLSSQPAPISLSGSTTQLQHDRINSNTPVAVSYKQQPQQHHPAAAASKAASAIVPLATLVPQEERLERWTWDEETPSSSSSSQQQRQQNRPMTDYEMRSSMLLRRQNRSMLGESGHPMAMVNNTTLQSSYSNANVPNALDVSTSASSVTASVSSPTGVSRPYIRVSSEWPESDAFAAAADADAAKHANILHNSDVRKSMSLPQRSNSATLPRNVHFSSSSTAQSTLNSHHPLQTSSLSSSPSRPTPSPTMGTLAGLRGSERAREAVERVEASLSPQRKSPVQGRVASPHSIGQGQILATNRSQTQTQYNQNDYSEINNNVNEQEVNIHRKPVAWFAPVRVETTDAQDDEEYNPLIPNASAPLLSSQSLVAQKRRLEKLKKEAAAASSRGHVSYKSNSQNQENKNEENNDDTDERDIQNAWRHKQSTIKSNMPIHSPHISSTKSTSSATPFGLGDALDKAKLRKIESLRARKEAEDAARKAQWAAARKSADNKVSSSLSSRKEQQLEQPELRITQHEKQVMKGLQVNHYAKEIENNVKVLETPKGLLSTRIPRLSPRTSNTAHLTPGHNNNNNNNNNNYSTSSNSYVQMNEEVDTSRMHQYLFNEAPVIFPPSQIPAVRYTMTSMSPTVAPLQRVAGREIGTNIHEIRDSPHTPLVPLPPSRDHIIQAKFPLARARSTTPSKLSRNTGGPSHHHITQSEAAAARAAAAAAAASAADVKSSITPSGIGGHGGSTTSSNRQKISNALQSLCLAGPARATHLAASLAALGNSSSPSFLILLSSPESHCYKGLYSFDPRTSVCIRIHGHGPTQLTSAALLARQRARDAGEGNATTDRLNNDSDAEALAAAAAAKSEFVVDGTYKFSTSSKQFIPILSKEVGLTSDAVTIRRR
jgi:hypothetical protein